MPIFLRRIFYRILSGGEYGLFTPTRTAFLASLVLSLIAIATSPSVNRDGMLYADTARAFLADGISGANAIFNWPFLPILMAFIAKTTGLGLDNSGYLLNALFFAGACSLLVACSQRIYPEAAWPICLALLSLPGPNHYRDEILREYGCWFFSLLAIWLAMLWSELPRWRTVIAAQAALAIAALFRPEAITLFIALGTWQLHTAPRGQKIRRALAICGLPILGLCILLLLFLSGKLGTGHRLATEFSRISIARFDVKAKALADSLIPYARNQAGTILFLGSLATVPLKYIKQFGIFIIPTLFILFTPEGRKALARNTLFNWLFLTHLLVLCVFVVDMQFLAGRYVALLHLLSAPVIGYGLALLLQRLPRWKGVIVALTIGVMLTNVVTFSSKKNYYAEAGGWLSMNAVESTRVYVETDAVAHYAGWRLTRRTKSEHREELTNALAEQRYDLVILEKDQDEQLPDALLKNNGFQIVARFGNPDDIQIIAASRQTGTITP